MKICVESIDNGKPYMLRNDGELLKCGEIHPYIIFDLADDIKVSLDYLFEDNYKSLVWFYKNTSKTRTKDNLRQLCIEYWRIYFNDDFNYKKSLEYLVGNFKESDSIWLTEEELIDLYQLCNNETNQEFCRVRTSALKVGIEHNGIYFRISSVGFNWFDLIWNTVYKFRDRVSDVTICTDTQSRGGETSYYKHKGRFINRMPIDEFINLSGSPIIEKFVDNIQEDLYKGMTLDETFELHPRKVNVMVNSRWKRQLEELFI